MRRVLSVCALLIAACSTPTGADGDLLTVLGLPNAVVLSNKTSDPVSYIIGTPNFLALYDPGPCTRPEGCNSKVAANSRVTISNKDIPGYEAGERTAVVIHWRGVAGYPNDGVQRLEIKLR